MKNDLALKEFLDKKLAHIKMNDAFYKQLLSFNINWENKSEIYQEFINSPLIGVHTISFSARDEGILFNDILGIDKDITQHEIYRVEGVNKNFIVSSNVTNVVITYLMHRALTEMKNNREMLVNLYKIFCYKQISSMYFNFFKFPLDRNKAVSVFEKLSDRFIIKKLGSWEKVFIYQAELMVIDEKEQSNKGNKSNRLKIMDFYTSEVITAINDMNGRIKDTICKLAEVLYNTIEDKNTLLKSVSSVSDLGDGEVSFTSMSGGEYAITQYLYSIINSKNDFIKPDIIDLVYVCLKKIDKDKFVYVLEHLVETDFNRGDKNDFIEPVMQEAIGYLQRQGIRGDYLKRLGSCIKKLNGYFRTATVKSKPLLNAKEILRKRTSEALNITTKSTISTYVIGVMLYIFIRALIKDKG